jgi:tetratricopeptide (TPR) repeat protein
METKPYSRLGSVLAGQLGRRPTTWLAAQCDVSRPAVSQWLAGETRPHKRLLPHIARILSLDVNEVMELAGYDTEEGKKSTYLQAVGTDDIEYAKNAVASFYRVQLEGNAPRACKMIDEWLPWVETKKKAAYGTSLYDELLKTQAQALYQKGDAYTEFLTPSEYLDDSFKVAGILEEFAEECEDDRVASTIDRLAHYRFGELWYHNKQPIKAIEAYNRALTGLSKSDYDDLALEAVRTIAVCQTLRTDLNEIEKCREVRKLRNKARSLIDTGKFSDEMVIETLEGIGLAESKVNLLEAHKTIDEAMGIINTKNMRVPFRSVQVIRSQLELVRHDPGQRSFVQVRGEEGRQLARLFGYKKYEHWFEGVLNQVLN